MTEQAAATAVDKPTTTPSVVKSDQAPKPTPTPASTNGTAADDTSWYGDAPSEDIISLVRSKLGDKVCDLFVLGSRQLDGSADNVSRVLMSTSTFVSALKLVPEDMQMTAAFGEMSLAYGRALVRYVEIEGSGSNAVAAKIVKALQTAVSGGKSEVDDGEGEEEDGDGDGEEGEEQVVEEDEQKKDDEKAEKQGEGDREEDIISKETPTDAPKSKQQGSGDGDVDGEGASAEDDEDLEGAWTQLEVARVIFAQEKMTAREAECRYVLGELLMACDEGKQAGAEFASAAILFSEAGKDLTRRAAECHYKRFLAIRNAERVQAAQALREAVTLFEGVNENKDDDVLNELKTELKDFEATVDEEEKVKKEKEVPAEVQVVRPKRKRDVMAAAAAAAAAAAETPNTEEQNGKGAEERKESNGCTSVEGKKEDSKEERDVEESATKKARMEKSDDGDSAPVAGEEAEGGK